MICRYPAASEASKILYLESFRLQYLRYPYSRVVSRLSQMGLRGWKALYLQHTPIASSLYITRLGSATTAAYLIVISAIHSNNLVTHPYFTSVAAHYMISIIFN